jgi:hypothetical protein
VAVTLNPGDEAITVHCNLAAFDPAGHVIYTGIFPPPLLGHHRSIGFSARPGRDPHGLFEVPIDLARHTYEATCREALWHGAPAI